MFTKLTFSLGAGVLALAISACDPCAGVVSCRTEPRVAVQGRIVDAFNGSGVSGVRISVVRVNAETRDSATTTSDDRGNYELAIAGDSGTFDVVVAASNTASYRVSNLSFKSTSTRGDANLLGVWVSQPIFGVVLELVDRKTGQLVTRGSVAFKRTSGVTISGNGVSNDTYTAAIDPSGRISLLEGVVAGGAGDVIGDLSVNVPGDSVTVLHDVHVPANYEFRPIRTMRLGLGPGLAWVISIYNRATVEGVPGTKVTFSRTDGIEVTPAVFTGTTDEHGQLLLGLTTNTAGTVIGDLTIEPPAPFHGYTQTGIELPTFETDGVRYYQPLGVGPHLPWLGVLTCGGQPAKGAQAAITRVGGIAATPASLNSTSDENGFIRLVFKPAEYGDLIVDLAVTAPTNSNCLGFVVHDLRLPTLDFDTDARFIGAWEMPSR